MSSTLRHSDDKIIIIILLVFPAEHMEERSKKRNVHKKNTGLFLIHSAPGVTRNPELADESN